MTIKIIPFIICCSLSIFAAPAQQDSKIRVVTTRRDAFSKEEMLSSYKSFKVRLVDSINSSEFYARFYLEKYTDKKSEIIYEMPFPSSKSKFTAEIMHCFKKNDSLDVAINTPGFLMGKLLTPENGSDFKCRSFNLVPLKKGVPLLLIYEDRKGDDSNERILSKIPGNVFWGKVKLMEEISKTLNSFYLLSYDVVFNSEKK
jgi:hypothetical protein